MPQDTISITGRELSKVLQPIPRNKRPESLPIEPDEKNKILLAKIEEQKGNAVENNIKSVQVVPILKGYNIDRFA